MYLVILNCTYDKFPVTFKPLRDWALFALINCLVAFQMWRIKIRAFEIFLALFCLSLVIALEYPYVNAEINLKNFNIFTIN